MRFLVRSFLIYVEGLQYTFYFSFGLLFCTRHFSDSTHSTQSVVFGGSFPFSQSGRVQNTLIQAFCTCTAHVVKYTEYIVHNTYILYRVVLCASDSMKSTVHFPIGLCCVLLWMIQKCALISVVCRINRIYTSIVFLYKLWLKVLQVFTA